jgi:hypothetical protein
MTVAYIHTYALLRMHICCKSGHVLILEKFENRIFLLHILKKEKFNSNLFFHFDFFVMHAFISKLYIFKIFLKKFFLFIYIYKSPKI